MAKATYQCVHLQGASEKTLESVTEDPASRDAQPEQANWICACGIYDRRWASDSRPRPGICQGPSSDNCPEFAPDPERLVKERTSD